MLPEVGYRPNYPIEFKSIPSCERTPQVQTPESYKYACNEYYSIVKWGEELTEAYGVRARANEWAIYVAGAVGVIGAAIVGALAATDKGNTDAAKITPPVAAAVAAILALNQSDEKAAAYSESAIEIEQAQAAADSHVSRNRTEEGFRAASEVLKGSIRQAIVNLERRKLAVRKKMAASIPMITGMTPQSFRQGESPRVTILIVQLEDDLDKVRVILFPETAVTNKIVTKDRVEFTLTTPACRDYMVMLSVENRLILPPKSLRCERTAQ